MTRVANRALIIGDDFGIFLAVARSLGRQGVEVHVAPSDDVLPGLASRYVAAIHALPPYHAAPAAWVSALRAIIDAHDYRLILPCSDSGLALLDHHAEALGRERLALPNGAALAAFTDKAETRALAARLGVPVAEGSPVARNSDAADLSERLGLPLVLKPRASYLLGGYETKRSAQIVRDLPTLERTLATGLGDGWIAESFFRGEGVGVSVFARNGRILLVWQHRRLEAASETGASTVRIAEPPDPRLLAHVEKLAEATALDGVAMFEFRCDEPTGSFVLLEVNARFWGSLPLAVAAGADFPAALWHMTTRNAYKFSAVPRTAIIKRHMTGEFDRLIDRIEGPSTRGKLQAAVSLMLLFSTLLFGSRFDSWAPDDKKPFFVERRQLAQRLMRALAKHLKKRLSVDRRLGGEGDGAEADQSPKLAKSLPAE